MKKLILTFTFLCALMLNVNAQNDSIPQTIEQQKTAKKVAVEWISMFFQAKDIDSVMKISKTPFALDNDKILNSDNELKEFYTVIQKSQQNQKPSELKVEIHGYKYEIIDELIPINVIYVKITPLDGKLKNNDIFIVVEISGDNAKVIGFRD